MNPEDAKKLDAYLDNELSTEARVEVDLWLARDVSARAQMEQIKSLRAEVRDASLPDLDIDVAWQSFQSKRDSQLIDEPDRLVLFQSNVIRPVLAIAAMVVILFSLSTLFFQNSNIQQQRAGAEAPSDVIEWMETDFEAANQVIYIDDLSGWAIVWVEEIPTGETKNLNLL